MTPALTHYADRLARYLVTHSERGLRDPWKWAELKSKFTEDEQNHLAEAAHELKKQGWISISDALNVEDNIYRIRPTFELYWTFDREVFDYDPDRDVADLIRRILEDETRGSADKLIKCQSWSLRRFNPAFARVVGLFPKGRVSVAQANEPYAAASVLVTAEERMELKALLNDIESQGNSVVEVKAESDDAYPDAPTTPPAITPTSKATGAGVVSKLLSHPAWTGIGVLVAIVGLVLVIYPPSEWWQVDDETIKLTTIEATRQALHTMGPSKTRLRDALQHFDFGLLPHTSNEQAKAMMQFLGARTVLAMGRGGKDATTGTFGEPDSNGLQYEVTIWKSTYDQSSRYGIRFGLSDSSYWGCNDSYMEIVKSSTGVPEFVLNPPHFAKCD